MLARYGFAALAVSMAAVVYRYDLLAVVRSGRFSPVKVHEEDSRKTLPKKPNVLKDQPTTNNKGDEGLGKGSFTSFASIAERDHLKATLQYYQLKSMKADSDEDESTVITTGNEGMTKRHSKSAGELGTCPDSYLDSIDDTWSNAMKLNGLRSQGCCTEQGLCGRDYRLYQEYAAICHCDEEYTAMPVDPKFGGADLFYDTGMPDTRDGAQHTPPRGQRQTTGRSRPPPGGGGGGGASECPCPPEYESFCQPPAITAVPGEDLRLLTGVAGEKVKRRLSKLCLAEYVKNVVGKGHTRGRGVKGS